MPEWLKVVLLATGVTAAMVMLSWVLYMESRKVCIRWEAEPVSTVCVKWEEKCRTGRRIGMDGKLHTRTICHDVCMKEALCRSCVEKLDREDPGVPAEVEIPEDNCEAVKRRGR